MVPLLEQDLRGVYKEEEGNILNVHLPHVHDSTLPRTARRVDCSCRSGQHSRTLHMPCAHETSKTKQGSGCEKGSIFLPTLQDVSILMGFPFDGEALEYDLKKLLICSH